MKWTIAEARRHFAKMVRSAEREPQAIFNRDRPAAFLLGSKEFEAFQQWRGQKARRTVGEAFTELRSLCAEEGYELRLAKRRNRGNEFAKLTDELSR